ncbi:MAG: ribosome rescue GTPase HflX [Succinivibrio sp.]|nr:GTPase HflX [Succinivibrio sp.]MCI5639024.1 GTPase HflX [Succinivibrio sp.]MCI7772404.1 GTPase HflX [Succinivibrio sp.]MCI7784107.1 GTPase HflX [Succinivibrio sp.]MDD7286353.1 GTPase HflX [Succinivibrio sp.]
MPSSEFESLGSTLLVHVELPQLQSQEDLKELQLLAESGGGEVAYCVCCKRETLDPSTFIGSGKVVEVADAVKAYDVQTVIFNNKLTPAQERNLEKAFGVRVMDRVALILTIFAQRARTYEGKLQVELAQLQYEQARLVRGWTHLERQKGGFGLRGGPGETQIELDRRALRERISAIKKDLEVVASRREQNRSKRKKNSVPVVSFVGYTNAGKSTLFNLLTKADVYAANQLFATLDPTLRTIQIPVIGKAVFADTVGFIRHLPHDLVAAFRGTLEETRQADLLLHIVDCSDEHKEANIEAVNAVLEQVGAQDIKTLIVYNKADLVPDSPNEIIRDENGKAIRVYVSALTSFGIDNLLQAVSELLSDNLCSFTVKIDGKHGKLRSLLYASKAVEKESYADDGSCLLQIKLTAVDAAIIDSKTQGQLSQTCTSEDKPWIQSTEFDFNSVD